MPRKPNYRFERVERERVKAAKKAARAEAKAEKAKASQAQPDADGELASPEVEPSQDDRGSSHDP
jgi:hypothetical protein